MAHISRQRGDDLIEIEISDFALVITVLGVAAGLSAVVWMVTRNPETLRQLGETAKQAGALLTFRGRPLLSHG